MQTTLALKVAPPSDEATSERFSADLVGDIAGALGVPVSRVRIGSMRAVPKAALQSRVRAGLLHEALIESGSSAALSEELLAEVLGPLSNEELAEVQRRFEHEHSRPLARAVDERLRKGHMTTLVGAMLAHANQAQRTPVDHGAAAEAACELRAAARGLGVREEAFVRVFAEASEAQLGAVARACEAQCGGRSLAQLVRSEFKGPLGALLLHRLQRAARVPLGGAEVSSPLAAKRARQLFKAGKDTWGTDEDVFIEIVGFSDAAEAAALRYEYAMRYGHTLGSAVRDEMSGELEALLLAFLHPPPAHHHAAEDDADTERQAKRLWVASAGVGTDEAVWVEVFAATGAAQLAALCEHFARHGIPLPQLIREEFGGDTKKLLLVRCQWALAHARDTAAAAAAAAAAALPACDRRLRAEDPQQLQQWAAALAEAGVEGRAALGARYVAAFGATLEADLRACAPSEGAQRELLARLAQPPTAGAEAAEAAEAGDDEAAETQAVVLLAAVGWGSVAKRASAPRLAAARDALLELLGGGSVARLEAVEAALVRQLPPQAGRGAAEPNMVAHAAPGECDRRVRVGEEGTQSRLGTAASGARSRSGGGGGDSRLGTAHSQPQSRGSGSFTAEAAKKMEEAIALSGKVTRTWLTDDELAERLRVSEQKKKRVKQRRRQYKALNMEFEKFLSKPGKAFCLGDPVTTCWRASSEWDQPRATAAWHDAKVLKVYSDGAVDIRMQVSVTRGSATVPAEGAGDDHWVVISSLLPPGHHAFLQNTRHSC